MKRTVHDITGERLRAYYEALRGRYGHQRWWPGDTALEVMVGAVLTQNTAWKNVEKAIGALKGAGVLEVGRLHALGPVGIAPLIRAAGYYNLKARRLWNLLDWFVGRYGGDFGRLEAVGTAEVREELLGVVGIGPETADAILLYCLGRASFVVDAYALRVLTRHGLLPADVSYAEAQSYLHRHLPAEAGLFNDYHAQLVRVGKAHCKKSAACAGCPLEGFLPGRGRGDQHQGTKGTKRGQKKRS